MKLIQLSALLILFTLSVIFANPKFHIAVLELEGVGIIPSECKILTNKLRTELVKLNTHSVLDRGTMDTILKEQGIQQSGCVASECAVEIGQLLGMSHIVAGSIGKLGSIFYVELKMINVETSKIENAVDTHIKGDIEELLLVALPHLAKRIVGIESEITYDTTPASKTPATSPVTVSSTSGPVRLSRVSNLGSLSVDVSPRSSELFINDTFVGKGDHSFDSLSPGKYKIAAVHKNLKTERLIHISANDHQRLDITVEPTSLYIEVEPDWATCYIDGKSYGRGDQDFRYFQAGIYTVELKTRKDSYTREMVIEQGGEQYFEIEMPGH